MGRHKDPKIVNFIQTLKRKGEFWGFLADDEYKLLNGLYFVDLTWRYRQDQSLFVTFQIEKKETERLLKNLEKIFSTPSSEVEKPYHHFVIVFDEKLHPGMRKIILEKARRYNIHLFENLKNDLTEKSRFNKELKKLKIDIPNFIERKGKINSTTVVYEVLKGLKNVVPILKIGNRQYPVKQSTMISEESTKTPLYAHDTQIFDSKRYKDLVIIPIPQKRFTLMINDLAIFDVYLKKQKTSKEVRLFAEACDFPYIFNFVLKYANGGIFDLKIDPNRADFINLKQFEDIMRNMNEEKTIQIFDRDRLIFKLEGLDLNTPLSSDQWYNAISSLAHIQKVTRHRIPCPKDFTLSPENLVAIKRLQNIIETGEEIIPLKKVTFTAYKEIIMKLHTIQEETKKISNLSFYYEQYSINLLSEEILLGPTTCKMPDIIFEESLEKVTNRIYDVERKIPIEITLVPFIPNTKVWIVYHKWKK